jgi:hypothetical protein
MVEHPGKFQRALAHHNRLDANCAGSRVPFSGSAALLGGREVHLHTDLLQGLQQLADRLPFPLEAGRIGDQGPDRLQFQWWLAGPAFVDIAVAAIDQGLGARGPLPVGLGQLAEQLLLVWRRTQRG